jgi:hypothetical protein
MNNRAVRRADQRKLRIRAFGAAMAVFVFLWLLLPLMRFEYRGTTLVDREIERILGIKKESKKQEVKLEEKKPREEKQPERRKTVLSSHSRSNRNPAERTREVRLTSVDRINIADNLPAGVGRRSLEGSDGRRRLTDDAGGMSSGRRFSSDLPGINISGEGGLDRSGGMGDEGGGGRRRAGGDEGGVGRMHVGSGGGGDLTSLGGKGLEGDYIRIPDVSEATPPRVDRSPILDWIEKNQRPIPNTLKSPENLDQRAGDVTTWVRFKDGQGKEYVLYLVGRRSRPIQLNIFLVTGDSGTLLQDQGAKGATDVFKAGHVSGTAGNPVVHLERLPAGDPEAKRMMAVFNAWWAHTQKESG